MTATPSLAGARAHLDDLLDLLAALVETNTHAENAQGIARCHALLAPHIEALGFDVERVTSSAAHPHDASRRLTRDHLVATSRAPAHGGALGRPTVLLMGHLDTVFPVDHAFQRLTRNGNEWRGPGVSDMKGGIVTALLTLALLREEGRLGDANWRLVLASDEESQRGAVLRRSIPTQPW